MRRGARPVAQPDVLEKFLPSTPGASVHYEPRIGAVVRAHFVDAKASLDAWQSWYYLAPMRRGRSGLGRRGDLRGRQARGRRRACARTRRTQTYRDPCSRRATTSSTRRALAEHIYRTAELAIMRCPSLKTTAAPGASLGEFRAQIAQTRAGKAGRGRRDVARADLQRGLQRSRSGSVVPSRKFPGRKSRPANQTMSSALSVGGSLLGALLGGRRRSSVFSQAGTAARSVGRIGKERTDVAHAEAEVVGASRAVCRAELGGRSRDSEPRNDIRSRHHRSRLGAGEAAQVRYRRHRSGARLAACLT